MNFVYFSLSLFSGIYANKITGTGAKREKPVLLLIKHFIPKRSKMSELLNMVEEFISQNHGYKKREKVL